LNERYPNSNIQVGARMRLIILDLFENGPSHLKLIILRTEGIEKFSSRTQARRLYSYTRSSMLRLFQQGFLEDSPDKVYKLTERGINYCRCLKD